ncbi:ubiquitin-activating enzyme e1, putative [Eimeria brunetti]|uniref:Ubiquitin-activating enzyme e1, putative n=1 Tax=Eimeria brunetti TaxID=51314 RepID=U6LMP5_9EIME|nr:ubiquitin-activating enzyme e1, putative [Eimeria brunetti]
MTVRAGFPYFNIRGQRTSAATAATAQARRPIQRSLHQQAALLPPSVSPPFPSDAVGAPGLIPPGVSGGHQVKKQQLTTDTALGSEVEAGDDLSMRALLSRQLLVWGPEQQKVLPGSRVLLIGAGGAAVEAAKCLLQSGVGHVLLADPEEPAPQERAANFALAEHAEQQELTGSEAAIAAEVAVAEAAGGSGAPGDPPGFPQRQQAGLSAQLLETHGQQQQPGPSMTRAGIACAALRRVGAPYSRVSEVSLNIQPGEGAAAWRARVENVLQQVDVLLLCDRPLQQKLFFSKLARGLWYHREDQRHLEQQEDRQKRQQQHETQPRRRRRGPLVVTVCTAGLTGRVAVDFGDFFFSRVNEEAALTALLEKHAQSREQQREEQQQQQEQQEQTGQLHFAPLNTILALPDPKRTNEGQQSLSLQESSDPQQQYLAAAFEALDAAETDNRGASEDPEQAPAAYEDGAAPKPAAATTEDSKEAAACAAAGSLRSWNANRLPASSHIAARSAAIWKQRYGPSVARAAAAAATAAASASRQSAAAVAAAADAAAAAAVSRGEAEAGRLGALMAQGSRGHLAPIAAAVGALAAQETLKGLTRKYRPLHGPFVLHALELLALTAQGRRQDNGKRGVNGNNNGSGSSTWACDRYARAASAFSSGQEPASTASAAQAEADSAAAADAASVGAARSLKGASRAARPRRVPWEGQQQLLGLELQRRLNHLRVLLVGAGAIGCEVLKNFALMGVSAGCYDLSRSNDSPSSNYCCNVNSKCSPYRNNGQRGGRLMRLLTTCIHGIQSRMLRRARAGAAGERASTGGAAREVCAGACQGGLLSLMDGDIVETSNLSRQVLFTTDSLQQSKATAAAAAALRFCSRARLRPFPFMLSPKTLWRLPSMYIQEQDLVVAALDSVEARLYVDALCLLHAKPWVEAGTLGLRGHSQSLVPYLTEHYAAAVKDAAINAAPTTRSLTAVPVCSVRGAPTAPLHAVHWASAQLQQIFKTDIAAARMLLQQLLELQVQLPRRSSAQQVYGSVGPPEAAPAYASTPGAPDDVQAALGKLRMAPVALAAAAAGPTRLGLLLRLAVEVLKMQRSKNHMPEPEGQQAPHELQEEQGEHRERHDERHANSGWGVSPLSTVHLRLLSFAVCVFSALYQTKVVERPTRGDTATGATSSASEEDVKKPCKQKDLLLDPTDADMLDFVAATAQLLAASLGLQSPAKAVCTLDSADRRSDSILQQQKEEELLLQGKGVGPWSRQSVGEALHRLLPNGACSDVGKAGLAGAGSDPTTVSLSALAEELVRELQGTASAATEVADLRRLGAPAAPSLSADGAVPLRFLTSAARLRCRAFGLTPLPGPEETQQLVGTIVPATATATTLAAAFACLEVYRLVALGLAGSHSRQCMQHGEQQQEQGHHGQIMHQTGRVSPVLWLDRGQRRNRQDAMKHQQRILRTSFFSLSVPFVAEAPPLPPPTHRFLVGRWRGQPFSPWHFFRLRLRGGGFNTSSDGRADRGAVPGEAEAAETITISELVKLLEKETRTRILSLTCEGTLLYATTEERETLQQQQLQAVLPPPIAASFDGHEQQTLPDPGTSLAEALRCAVVVPSHNEAQQCQQQQRQSARHLQQQDKGSMWVVVLIGASDSSGADIPLPALKVLIRPTV